MPVVSMSKKEFDRLVEVLLGVQSGSSTGPYYPGCIPFAL
jgi:hypothetical protein